MSPFCIVVTADIIMNVYLLFPLRDLNWNKNIDIDILPTCGNLP
jgi:hypothetical protein